jgi:hypothetical protein
MRNHPSFGTVLPVALILAALLAASAASADEVQLAGLRLGQHSLKVLKVYGQPDCIITGADGPGTVSNGASPGAAGQVAAPHDFPDWAYPVTITMTSKETMWCYHRGDVALGVVLDRDGFVVALGVSGKRCDWVRTALGEPLRTIKLGDSMQRIIDRYGYPMTTSVESGSGFSRDIQLHYGYGQNITFTCRDMKVNRIYIWEAQPRGTGPVRLPSPADQTDRAFPAPAVTVTPAQ